MEETMTFYKMRDDSDWDEVDLNYENAGYNTKSQELFYFWTTNYGKLDYLPRPTSTKSMLSR